MKKLLCILLALTLLCTLFVGCGKKADEPVDKVENNEPVEDNKDDAPADEPADEQPAEGQAHVGKRVVGIWMTLADTHWQMMNDYLGEQLRANGMEYDALSGELDPLKQVEQIENAVIQGYDMIFIIPITGEAVADACQRAMDEGVFVYCFINSAINCNVYRSVVPEVSGETCMTFAAEWALEHFPNAEPGSINTVIMGLDGTSHQLTIFDAIKATAAKYPELNVIEAISVTEDVQDGQAKAENILTMYPDTEIHLWVIAATSAAVGVNAAIMAENSGVDYKEDVCVVFTAVNEEVAGLLRASLTNDSVVRLASANGGNINRNLDGMVEDMINLFNGVEVPAFSPVNIDLVTPENVADFGY